MNYRHAYHAGNAGDCLKHALLVELVEAMLRKRAGFSVLDTHAGIGAYDLGSAEAVATGEGRGGIGRLRQGADPVLERYVALAGEAAAYPGSPVLVRRMLRPQDRLVCCELHPQDAATLRRRFAGDGQVSVHQRDGYEALRGLLPPAAGRGLVLIDPPYEQPDEWGQVADGLKLAAGRFRAGVLAAWYPIKGMAAVRAFHAALAGLRDVVSVQLLLRPALDAARLNGSGMVVVNPPFGFVERAGLVAEALRAGLAEPGGSAMVERLADE